MSRADRGSNTTETVPLPALGLLGARVRPYYPMAIQFLLGSLFSAYAVFYFHSASFTGTAVFFALLVGLLVGNEFLHDRVSNFKLMLALYALAACSFLTFFLPVMTGRMTTAIIASGKLVRERPDVMRRWMIAYMKGIRDILQEMQEAEDALICIIDAAGLVRREPNPRRS